MTSASRLLLSRPSQRLLLGRFRVLFPDSVDRKQPLAREIAINATRCRFQGFAPLSSRRSTSGPPSSRSAVRRRFTCTRQVADLARLQVRFGARERSLGVGTTELVCREPTLSSPFVRDVPVEEFSRVRHSLRREDDASENRGKSMYTGGVSDERQKPSERLPCRGRGPGAMRATKFRRTCKRRMSRRPSAAARR